ncbi:hypothetical protein A0256_20885 [Mucilaginibacter sp. PAMC 26640]|nr:hypothetical protein A0256_20885 [Mucilaginibacter sp. PAMC 26640]
MKLKASALYMVIIIALVIAVICSSLIVAAYFYRLQYQNSFKYNTLQLNLGSATNILLTDTSYAYQDGRTTDLFKQQSDSVFLRRIPWGILDIGIACAFSKSDTLYNVFSIGKEIDSARWSALYVIDQDRPISVSGKTLIKGDAYLPKPGIREAYLENRGYEGDKRLVIGKIKNSARELPVLSPQRVALLRQILDTAFPRSTSTLLTDSNSFRSTLKYIYLGKSAVTLNDISLQGNIMIVSDTTITIGTDARLDNVIISARKIIVDNDFHGRCQLFAKDTLSIGERCVFTYPSCLATMRFHPRVNSRAVLHIGKRTVINGTVLLWQDFVSEPSPILELTENAKVVGQIYSQGAFSYKEGTVINGSLYTSRFLYQTVYSAYENYLVGSTIDASKLSRYYLTGMLLPASGPKNKIMQWLEKK